MEINYKKITEILNQIKNFIINNDNKEEFKKYFENCEKQIKDFAELPFYLVIMEHQHFQHTKMLHLSEDFYKLLEIETYHKNNIDIWHYFLDNKSIIKYIKAIKNIKAKEKPYYTVLTFITPNQNVKKLITFSLYYKKNTTRYTMIITFVKNICKNGQELNFINLKKISTKIFLQKLLKKTPISIVITNVLGQIVYVNKYFEKLTGYSKAEVIGLNPRILKSGHTPPKTFETLWNKITQGKVWHGSLINKKKNGELYYENAVIFPIFDLNDNTVYYVGLKTDITKQVKFQRKFLKRQKLIRLILKSLNIGFGVITNNKTIITNSRLKKIIEQTDILNKINKNISKSNYYTEILKFNKKYFDLRAYKKNNTIFLLMLDITYTKKIEKKLEKKILQTYELVEKINIPICITNSTGEILFINDALKKFDKTIKIGDNIQHYIYLPSSENEQLKYDILNKNINDYETYFLKERYKKHRVSITNYIVKEYKDKTELVYFVIYSLQKLYRKQKLLEKILEEKDYDIKKYKNKIEETDFKIAEMNEQLIELSIKTILEQKNLLQLKTDFISKVSHEFKTPLATIQTTVDLLSKYHKNMTYEQLNEKYSKIKQQIFNLKNLLDDVLLTNQINQKNLIFAQNKLI